MLNYELHEIIPMALYVEFFSSSSCNLERSWRELQAYTCKPDWQTLEMVCRLDICPIYVFSYPESPPRDILIQQRRYKCVLVFHGTFVFTINGAHRLGYILMTDGCVLSKGDDIAGIKRKIFWISSLNCGVTSVHIGVDCLMSNCSGPSNEFFSIWNDSDLEALYIFSTKYCAKPFDSWVRLDLAIGSEVQDVLNFWSAWTCHVDYWQLSISWQCVSCCMTWRCSC